MNAILDQEDYAAESAFLRRRSRTTAIPASWEGPSRGASRYPCETCGGHGVIEDYVRVDVDHYVAGLCDDCDGTGEDPNGEEKAIAARAAELEANAEWCATHAEKADANVAACFVSRIGAGMDCHFPAAAQRVLADLHALEPEQWAQSDALWELIRQAHAERAEALHEIAEEQAGQEERAK